MVFANNTLSGLFVVIGLAVADGFVCAAGLVAATLSTLMAVVRKRTIFTTAKLLKNRSSTQENLSTSIHIQVFCQSWDSISNGLMTYNGVLVGTVTASLCPSIVEGHNGPDVITWCLIIFGAIMRFILNEAF